LCVIVSSGELPVAAPATTNLSRQTVAGLRWSSLDALCNGLILVGWTAASSRLLDPEVFGLMAVANLVVNFGTFFARMGVAQALVQKERISDDDIRATFTSGVLTGVFCFAALWLAAPALSTVFAKPEVTSLLRVLGASFLFTGLAMTSMGLLRRQLRFREIAIVGIVSNLLSSLLGIALAVTGAGVWSLIAYALSSPVFMLVLSYSRARHSLRPTFAISPFRSLYSFGARVSVLRMLEFFARNLDTITVGRYMTAAVLGQYSRAYVLVNLPLNRYLASSLNSVLFPTFSSIQSDTPRLKRGLLSALSLGAVVIHPICAGMAVAAPEIVATVLGPQWDVAAQIVPLFALGIGFNVLTRAIELLCEARGELNRNLGLQIAYVLALGAALVLVSPYGVVTMAAVLLVGEVVRHIGFVLLARSLLDLNIRDLWQAYAPAFFAASVVAALTAVVRMLLLAAGLPAALVLVAEIGAGALGLALAIRLNPVPEVRQLLAARLRNAGLLTARRSPITRMARVILGPAA